jgi:transcriptional regulator with XRE-family HTH domain
VVEQTELEKWLARWVDYGLARKGWTQRELAEAAYVTEKHISHMLNGVGAGSVPMWDLLLGTLEIRDQALGRQPPKEKR